MRGQLALLSERVEKNPLIFKERKDMAGFYSAGKDILISDFDGLKKESEGIFENFYPEDAWYEKEAVILRSFTKEDFNFFSEKKEDNGAKIKGNNIKNELYLYSAYLLASGAGGDELSLTESGKKLILSASFLEADVLRATLRKDLAPIIRRAEKTASLYLDYYYEGGPIKNDKGYLSRSFSNFMRIIFFLTDMSSLQDKDFII